MFTITHRLDAKYTSMLALKTKWRCPRTTRRPVTDPKTRNDPKYSAEDSQKEMSLLPGLSSGSIFLDALHQQDGGPMAFTAMLDSFSCASLKWIQGLLPEASEVLHVWVRSTAAQSNKQALCGCLVDIFGKLLRAVFPSRVRRKVGATFEAHSTINDSAFRQGISDHETCAFLFSRSDKALVFCHI